MRHKSVWTRILHLFCFVQIGDLIHWLFFFVEEELQSVPTKQRITTTGTKNIPIFKSLQFSDVENVWQRFFRMWRWCVRWTWTTAKISFATTATATIFARLKCCAWNNHRVLRGWTLRFGRLCCHSGKLISSLCKTLEIHFFSFSLQTRILREYQSQI